MPNNAEDLRKEKIAYAKDIIEGFLETHPHVKVSVVLDALADEYDSARKKHKGMDPTLVRILVQQLIDVAKFPKDNEPDTYDPDQPSDTAHIDEPFFRYFRPKGRPIAVDTASKIIHTVAAVEARFELNRYRNAEPSPHKNQLQALSACDVVALANKDLRIQPASYSGVRDCLERDRTLESNETDGRARGLADRKAAIKMATKYEG